MLCLCLSRQVKHAVKNVSTSRHNNISQPHAWLDVLLEGRLHKLVVLLDDAFDVPPPLGDVPAEAAHETDV